MEQFEHRKDSGRLMATKSKEKENSPDYWGEIAINIKDMTKVQKTDDGLHVFKIKGWKRKSRGGSTYLSLAVDRFIFKEESGQQMKKDDDLDGDIPF